MRSCCSFPAADETPDRGNRGPLSACRNADKINRQRKQHRLPGTLSGRRCCFIPFRDGGSYRFAFR